MTQKSCGSSRSFLSISCPWARAKEKHLVSKLAIKNTARKRFLRLFFRKCEILPKIMLARRSNKPSSPCRLTSTTLSAKRRAMLVASPVSTFCASSMNRPPHRSATASAKIDTKRSSSMTWAAAHSISPSCASATACTKYSRPSAIHSSVAKISIIASSKLCSQNSKTKMASICIAICRQCTALKKPQNAPNKN